MLDINTIWELFAQLIEEVATINPDIQWILTVSPVRHWKDGAADNHWSKSILTCAVRGLESSYDNAHYFPSYEIMMDELRDHRFYERDLIHPNEQAIQHIWQRFEDACINPESREINKAVTLINKRQQHRAINPEGKEHIEFLRRTVEMSTELVEKYPHLKS